MNYNTIRKMDISNGPGIRVSIFMQGCTFNCKNCFNPNTHDFNQGKPFTDETIDLIIKYLNKDYIEGLSILGGEPFHPKNIDNSTKLARIFKEKYPNKTLWMWTGYTYETDLIDKEILEYVDVLVDGRYVDELHDFRLKYCGSSNQRVIDIKKSRKNKKIVLFYENKLENKEEVKCA